MGVGTTALLYLILAYSEMRIIRLIAHTRCTSGLGNVDTEAAREIQAKLSTLIDEIAANSLLQAIPDDGGPDIKDYNEELRTLQQPKWLKAPWLYTECFMYRLVATYFTTSTPFWQSFDVFAHSKRLSFEGSHIGTVELVKRFRTMLDAIQSDEATDEATQKAIFEEMVQISLWGNATDLSLLTSLSVEELQSRQGKEAREASKANVMVDDTHQVWDLLSTLKKEKTLGEIHYVLDNAGFELLTDLVFASYLIESGYTTKVVLHGKRMPWFVSDVNLGDLKDLIEGFAHGTMYDSIGAQDKQALQESGKYWQQQIDNGTVEFAAHPFWTTQHPYGRMAEVEPHLYEQLAMADLVIYKGDLNYRKLTYDGMWPKTTSFKEAIGPLAKKNLDGKGTRSLVLRTCKSDVAVGLNPGVEENLPKDWTRTGKYAVVSYWDAKS
ncbi:MAG: hypothetical protein Q9163_000226 [Psora crenata]